MTAAKHADVLIAGAGPTGLMMAAQLLRYGIQPMIIDTRSGPSTQSKALVVQARTLEIYAQLGIAGEAVAHGKRFTGASMHVGGKEYNLDFANAAAGQTAYPFALIYEQHKNERLLLDLLTKNACPVLWQTELLDFTRSDGLYHVRVFHQQKEQVFTCRYLIGADGARSRVRKQSGISFEGGTYASRFYLVDAVLENPPQNKHIHFYLRHRNFIGMFPMFNPNTYRLIGVLPKNMQQKELGFEDVRPLITKIIPEMPVEKCVWFSQYNLHHRSVGTFRQGNVFLAGDAAHIHSPAGGQGMNTGLQDATNLAWKLAGVINGHFDERILATYNAERLPIARELIKTTDRIFSMMTSLNPITQTLRNLILPVFFRLVNNGRMDTSTVFSRVSQIRIAYRHSPLSLHLSHRTKIRAGDRLPFLQVENPKTKEVSNVQEWNHKPTFCLILLDRLNRIDMPTLRHWLSKNYPTLVDTYYLPHTEKNEPVFSAFEVGEADKKMILIRPDGYIGLIADGVDMLLLQRYFQQMVRSGN